MQAITAMPGSFQMLIFALVDIESTKKWRGDWRLLEWFKPASFPVISILVLILHLSKSPGQPEFQEEIWDTYPQRIKIKWTPKNKIE